MIGSYKAAFYSINGLTLETKKRREHLSAEEMERNKTRFESFAKGAIDIEG